MNAHGSRFRLTAIAIAAGCLAALSAQAAEPPFPASGESPARLTPAQSAQPAASSAYNEKFRQLRATCEKDVPLGKANGDICVDAAMLLMGDPALGSDLPDDFREMKEDQRIKIALRLLERGVDSSNLARARAYDFYNKIGFLGLSPYSDPYRAKELMDMMDKSGYPGGVLRKIRANTSILSITSPEADKRENCATAKKLLAEGKLDADSLKIAQDVVATGICLGYEPPKQ